LIRLLGFKSVSEHALVLPIIKTHSQALKNLVAYLGIEPQTINLKDEEYLM